MGQSATASGVFLGCGTILSVIGLVVGRSLNSETSWDQAFARPDPTSFCNSLFRCAEFVVSLSDASERPLEFAGSTAVVLVESASAGLRVRCCCLADNHLEHTMEQDHTSTGEDVLDDNGSVLSQWWLPSRPALLCLNQFSRKAGPRRLLAQ